MNIMLLSTDDQYGACAAAYRLHRNLKASGNNSKMIVKRKTVSDADIIQYPLSSILRRAWNRARTPSVLSRTDPKYHFYSDSVKVNYVSAELLLEQIPFNPDAIIVLWVSQFINPKNVYELNKTTGAPVLWYLMDMAPFTGGCHYAWNCDGYQKTCGTCPALHSSSTRDISYQNFKRKLHYFRQTNLTLVSGTSWLTKQAGQSALFKGKRIEQIMLGIDSDVFRPLDRSIGRTILDLPMDKKIIFFGAKEVGEERKGGKYMVEALRTLSTSLPDDIKGNILLVIAGKNDNDAFTDIFLPHKFVGFLNDDRILALAYQAADVFVCPSIEDSGPMMINEAIMCGTPVVAFDMGVAPDLVYNGKTGYRAKLKDSKDLAKGIAKILNLNNDEYIEMSRNCRQLGLELCSPKVQVEGFERLFKEVANQALH